MSNKDTLRSATIGKKSNVVKEIVKYNGNDYELRQPTMRVLRTIREKCSTVDGKGTYDTHDLIIWSVIHCTFVPNTDELVFDDTDYDTFLNQTEDSFVLEFGIKITKLANLDYQKVKKN